MESIERKFKESNKAETKNLMSRLANTKYEGGSVREHLMGLVDTATKLNRLKKYENKGVAKWEVKKQNQSQKNSPLGVTPTTELNCYFCKKNDTGASIHIAHNVQEFTRCREPRKYEVKVSVRNGKQVDVEAIGVVNLKLDS
ncbi:hypothetical protein L3X38_024481 [Prunus dulcis]|uniref:Uncharacterized protein n=1 Tax=Prunus dulcis TaxID=3755 RepID=A0AAD4W102_PRUDU|nr:hypothetical protein L3X38_024481 [Prunus dulcis]